MAFQIQKELTEEQQKTLALLPRVGDPIPGTNLKFEEADIANLQAGGSAITGADLTTTPSPSFQTSPPPSPAPIIPEIPELKATPQEEEQSDITRQIREATKMLEGESVFRTEQERVAGTEGLRKTQLDLTNQLRALQAEAEATKISPEFEQRATLTQFAEGERARKLRDIGVRALIVSANLQAAQGNLASALDSVERSVRQRFDPIREQIAIKKANLDLIINDPATNRAERNRALQQKAIQDERDREVERQEQEQETIWKIGIEAATKGADSITLRNIQNSKTAIEATQFASKFIGPQTTFEQRLDSSGNLVELELDPRGKVVNQRILSAKPIPPTPIPITTPEGETLVYGTPEYVKARLQATSSSKTKPVASEREQLGKFANVVALTGNVVQSLSKTTNDPILGYLKSLNPYDFDARAVNAQVTALVPSVARALYGEVGVLTDTDIERYLKTLPNIKSTNEQNKFIAMMTLANARRAYEQTLLNLASSNVNVSGFVDSYDNLVQQLDGLEKELRVGEIEISGEDEAVFDEVVQPSLGFTGYIKNLWGALWGK